jgi:hypothetical protein
VVDPELVQTVLPLLQLASVGATKADVVKSRIELVEPMVSVGGRVRGQREHEAAWQHKDNLVEPLVVLGHRRHLLVEDGRCVQQPLIPLAGVTSRSVTVNPT